MKGFLRYFKSQCALIIICGAILLLWSNTLYAECLCSTSEDSEIKSIEFNHTLMKGIKIDSLADKNGKGKKCRGTATLLYNNENDNSTPLKVKVKRKKNGNIRYKFKNENKNGNKFKMKVILFPISHIVKKMKVKLNGVKQNVIISGITDCEDENSSLTESNPLIIISPESGEEIESGTLKQILWYLEGNEEYVNILLYKNGDPTGLEIMHVENSGIYDWNVPNLEQGNDYSIVFTNLNNDIIGISGYFTILDIDNS